MSTPADVTEALARVTAALPAGEARAGQVEMALAVARAIVERRHVVVQAGTGTGKSLAYLVPAIVLGARTVVATATKALQDQLAGKDLPFIAQHLGREVRWSVLKGRSNYLCLQKAGELGEEGGAQLGLAGLESGRDRHELVQLLSWARTAPTGDRAELDFEPAPRTWAALSAGADECPGAARCPMGEHCFAEAARRKADDADVVVVNAHLYGVHVASGGWVLGDHDLVVFDEVHELEDVASATLGSEVGARRFAALARALRGILADAAPSSALEQAGTRLDAALAALRGQRLDDAAREAVGSVLDLCAARVDAGLAALRRIHPPPGGAAARRERAMKAASSLAEALATARSPTTDDVAWVEGPDHAPVLRVAPVAVGSRLAAGVWDRRVAVLTSATVPPGLPARLGLPEGGFDQLDVGSPFDYRTQSLLYCARHLPDPRHPDHQEAVLAELEALIRAAGGRTLALFTSWRAMRAAAEALGGTLPWRLLTQADLPKPALLRTFTEDETSCLFATMGFWQGVDVPGPALSLVVIDRLPFPRPDEPLTQARRERAGAAAFSAVDVPRAATLLAQGAGRLIRSSSDRGVVAVLDPRLARAGYRQQLLAVVPPMRRTVDRAEVVAFLGAVWTEPATGGHRSDQTGPSARGGQ